MSISSKKCLLFTNSYPIGENETFIDKEIPYLSQFFQEVEILNLETFDENYKFQYQNVKIKNWFYSSKLNSLNFIFKHFWLLLSVFKIEFQSHFKFTLLNFRIILLDFIQQIKRADSLMNELKNQDLQNIVFYSFWMDRWVSILSIVKFYNPNFKFISRAHAFDLYEEDNRNGYIKFRKFQLKSIEKVFAVSDHGSNYLKKKYSKFIDKFQSAYLGKESHEIINPFDKEKLVIVSCGSVQERKRIKEIPQVLSHLKTPFQWIHFGDGGEMAVLLSNIKNFQIEENITLMGHVTNEVFLSYLKNNPISFLISLSRNEGLPYTMIEAISYGIPIIATDAMGSKEICNENTGVLLPLNFEHQNVAKLIEEFYFSDKNSEEFRKNVKQFFQKNFVAEKNYYEFYNQISK